MDSACAGDAGGSLGAALDHYYSEKENKRITNKKDSMKGSLLGKESTESEILDSLYQIIAFIKTILMKVYFSLKFLNFWKREWSLAGIKEEWSSVLGL